VVCCVGCDERRLCSQPIDVVFLRDTRARIRRRDSPIAADSDWGRKLTGRVNIYKHI